MIVRCPKCGEDVVQAVLGDNSRSKDQRGERSEVHLLLDPTPSPRGNVILNGERCGYVNNWNAVQHFKIPVYRRHGLSCINPLGTLLYRGVNWEPEDGTGTGYTYGKQQGGS